MVLNHPSSSSFVRHSSPMSMSRTEQCVLHDRPETQYADIHDRSQRLLRSVSASWRGKTILETGMFGTSSRRRLPDTQACQSYRPDLVDTLLNTMQQALQNATGSSDPRLVLHRSLLILKAVVRSLSTNRMLSGKKILGQVSRTR